MDTAPRDIRVHIVTTNDYTRPLGGVGEPGLPPVAPAIANAVYAATGKRIEAVAEIRDSAAVTASRTSEIAWIRGGFFNTRDVSIPLAVSVLPRRAVLCTAKLDPSEPTSKITNY